MRKKRSRFNPIKSDIVILDGGLNENVSSLELKPGELIRCLNYQHVLGSQGGYQSIAGYERFDGQTKPSTISASGTNSLLQRQARAKIQPVPGSGDIRGIYMWKGVLYAFRNNMAGTRCHMWKSSNRGWQEVNTDNYPLTAGGDYNFFEYNFFGSVEGTSPSASPSEGTPSDSPSEGTASDTPSASPSEGTPSSTPSEGTASGTPSEGTASATPSASPSEGTPSDTPSEGTPSDTPSEGTPSDTPSEGTPSEGTPSGTPSDSPSGSPSEGTPSGSPSEETPSSSPSYGTGTPSDSPSEGTPSSSPSAGTPSNSPGSSPSDENPTEGTPSSTPSEGTPSEGTPSDSPSASASSSPDPTIYSENLFFTNGVNKACRFDGKAIYPITTGMSEDTPINLTVFNNRLFLAFGGGSLQYSGAGSPNDWGITAGEFGIGRDIKDLVTGVGNSLIVFCKNGIRILTGTSPDDWVLETFSDSSGAYEHTAKRLLGDVFFMDDRGVTSLQAVDAFGNFEASSLSEKVFQTIQQNKHRVTCATVSRDLNQYRLFLNTGYALYFSFQDKRLRGITLIKFDDPVDKIFEGEDQNGNNVIFFTSSNKGLVYQMDSGTSFDGDDIDTLLTTSYYHYKSPRLWKKFKTLLFEIGTKGNVSLEIVVDYGYGRNRVPRGGEVIESLAGSEDEWGEEDWGEIQLAADSENVHRVMYHVMGIGTNLNVTLRTSSRWNVQHVIQNFITDYQIGGRQL